MPAASCGQASTVNEEWPRAFADLHQLLAKRFYVNDWIDGFATHKDAYNAARPATLLAELRTPFGRGGGHVPSAPLLLSGQHKTQEV